VATITNPRLVPIQLDATDPDRVAAVSRASSTTYGWSSTTPESRMPLPEDGRRRAVGLYRAASDKELEAILDSLPLRPWMEISVTALAEHPNDPARSAA
jgi:muconolactone delta-isomerase